VDVDHTALFSRTLAARSVMPRSGPPMWAGRTLDFEAAMLELQQWLDGEA
jgi:hypothetical protein